MTIKKIYIAGAGGMLGNSFYKVFKDDYDLKLTDKDVNENWISYLDFRKQDDYINDVKNFNPDYLFHLGAYTDLEYCELNSEDAYLTNTESVTTAVKIANELKIPLLYISTAGIFDGSKDCFDESDAPNPLGIYARSKYLGEVYVQEHANDYIITRAGWMMGGGKRKDKKFIFKLIKQIESGLKELNIVNDRDGTPTYTLDFARNVKLILESNHRGLFNLVCSGQTSRLEVAKEVLKILNLDDQIKLSSVDSSFFDKEYFAERPTSERLINKRLNELNLNIMRDWKIALKDYLDSEYLN